MSELKRKDLIYPELCYKVIGMLFVVWKELGSGHKEKLYQNAISEEFKNANLQFKKELPVNIVYKNKKIGMYYFDFLIEDKLVLETKVRNYFSKKDIQQLHSYLKVQHLKLGLIAHFTQSGVKFKRVVNLI